MNGYKVADWIEKAPYSEYDSAKLAIITLKELQKENDEMLKGIKDIYKWLESTCPDGFADETFRCLPVSILRKAQEK